MEPRSMSDISDDSESRESPSSENRARETAPHLSDDYENGPADGLMSQDSSERKPVTAALDDHENDPADSLMSQGSSEKKPDTAALDNTQGIRRKNSGSVIQHFLLDALLTVPSICFIVYGIIALRNNGRSIDEEPVPALRMAATYSPTVFPIVFAAVTANLLKATAGWKMERGVTVLSLEYLLSCRTVSSAVTTPLSLRRVNVLALLLIALWAMSPLGGQAALRITGVSPSRASELWPFECLEFMSVFPHSGAQSSAGFSLMPAIQGAFVSALSSPAETKAGPRDTFGNVKIPMLEHYPQTTTTDVHGWYDVRPDGVGTIWSAIMGIPVATQGGFVSGQNYSFTLNTSYMNTNCSVKRGESMGYQAWADFVNKTQGYTTNRLLMIKGGFHNRVSKAPMDLTFTAYYAPEQITTNATCSLTTTHAEVDVACRGSVCGARRIRRIEKPENRTVTTVFDGIIAEGSRMFVPVQVFDSFMKTFMRVTLTTWEADPGSFYKPFPSPLETYFTHPSAPFSAPGIGSWNGTDIYQVGDVVFSQRFSQLLNTFWLSSVASLNITGDFNFQTHRMLRSVENTIIQNITGTKTPDQLVLQVSGLWISVLFIASTVMLASGIAASIFGCLRRGPDVLDRATFFLRDSPHVNMIQQNTLEDGTRQVKRTKNLRVCIGDIRPMEETGYVAFGTVGEAMPLSWQEKERRYT